MTELRNVEADLSRFRARVLVASAVILLAFAGWLWWRMPEVRALE